MAIAPITGKLRKKLLVDIATTFGVAIGTGYAYWYGVHMKTVQRREQLYLQLEREKQAAAA